MMKNQILAVRMRTIVTRTVTFIVMKTVKIKELIIMMKTERNWNF